MGEQDGPNRDWSRVDRYPETARRHHVDYGDHTTGDPDDFWGLHLWGDAIDPAEVTDWAEPKPFEGEDEFGRFAWIERGGTDSVTAIGHDQRTNPSSLPDLLGFWRVVHTQGIGVMF